MKSENKNFKLVPLGKGEVAPLGVGTMMWGTYSLDRVLLRGKVLPDSQLSELAEIAFDSGITFFDSAEGYGGGSSEQRLNHLDIPSKGYVSTKFLPTLWKFSHYQMEHAVRMSAKRLGVDSIDMYYLHTPVHPLPLEFWVKGAVKCQKKGLIKALGISNCDAAQVRRAHQTAQELGSSIASNQINLSLLSYNHAKLKETIQVCQELGIQIVNFSVLGQGLLSESLTQQRFEDGSIRAVKMTGLAFSELMPLREKMQFLATKHNVKMSQIAINWSISKGFIPLVGCKTPNHIENAAKALSFQLSKSEVADLDAMALDKSTLSKPRWKRALFVTLISCLMIAYRIEEGARWIWKKLTGKAKQN